MEGGGEGGGAFLSRGEGGREGRVAILRVVGEWRFGVGVCPGGGVVIFVVLVLGWVGAGRCVVGALGVG